MRIIRSILGLAPFGFGSASASAATILLCSSSGQAYTVTETSTGTTIATAGYCADGPWAIDLFLMPVGSTEPAESDWRRDRPLRAAYETLRKLPDRPLIWRRASRSEAALFDNLTPRGRLVVRVNRLPRKAAESILKGAQR